MAPEAAPVKQCPGGMKYGREEVQAGIFDTLVADAAARGLLDKISDAEFEASLARILDGLPADRDVWVFAYGSLLWNPTFDFVEQRVAVLEGWHRSFCMWTPVGRGTPERPGLTLGLDRGGACIGVAFRIAAEVRERELTLLWRREMLVHAYEARWVELRCGRETLPAITMTMDPTSKLYAAGLEPEAIARTLATAAGELGSARDYLENTVSHLRELGFADRGLRVLLARVRALATDDA